MTILTKLKPWYSLIGIGIFAVILLAVAPSILTMHWVNNLGKYCAWAIVAVGIGLAWGRGGMLVMGQGVFFGLGAYAMAMHMTLETAGPDALPGFMILYDPLAPLPAFWEPFRSPWFTLLAILVLPIIVAGILGFALFKRRVKGAYFAILTRALAVALAIWISSTIRETGGDTGLSGFTSFFGYDLQDPANQVMVYLITASLLVVCMVVVWQLYRSRLGAMFVPLVGIITPQEIGASASILMIAGVALGGRASLFGPVLGAMAIGWGQSSLASSWPDGWVYLLGLLFVVVTLFLPNGLASLVGRVKDLLARDRTSAPAPLPIEGEAKA